MISFWHTFSSYLESRILSCWRLVFVLYGVSWGTYLPGELEYGPDCEQENECAKESVGGFAVQRFFLSPSCAPSGPRCSHTSPFTPPPPPPADSVPVHGGPLQRCVSIRCKEHQCVGWIITSVLLLPSSVRNLVSFLGFLGKSFKTRKKALQRTNGPQLASRSFLLL